MSQSLMDFVQQALLKGNSRAEIATALEKGGWSSQEIQEALGAFVDAGLALPVPRKRASTSPREAFLFLVLFSSLYIWLFALGSASFDLLNLWFPQPGEFTLRWISSLRSGLASVLVAFSLFLFVDHIAGREARRNPGQRISPIRRWLTYLTLFLASIALVSDLITLTLTFLEGEVTLRFAFKVLVVAVLAGLAFSHYLRQLRREEREPDLAPVAQSVGRWLVAAGVLVILIPAFWNAGSPLRARLYRQDEQRLQDLRSIRNSLSQYVDEHNELPKDLLACDVRPSTAVNNKQDPVTREPYLYRVVDADHAEIGARFALPTSPRQSEDVYWKHGAGVSTFLVEVTRKKAETH